MHAQVRVLPARRPIHPATRHCYLRVAVTETHNIRDQSTTRTTGDAVLDLLSVHMYSEEGDWPSFHVAGHSPKTQSEQNREPNENLSYS